MTRPRFALLAAAIALCACTSTRPEHQLGYYKPKDLGSEADLLAAERSLRKLPGVVDVYGRFDGTTNPNAPYWHLLVITDGAHDLDIREKLLALGFHQDGMPPDAAKPANDAAAR